MGSRDLVGALRLPLPVMFAEEALGFSVEVPLSEATVVLTVPVLPAEPRELSHLECPLGDEVLAEKLARSGDERWGVVTRARGDAWTVVANVESLGLEAAAPNASEDGLYLSTQIGHPLEEVWGLALAWLEVWTRQHLQSSVEYDRMAGDVYEVEQDPPQLTGWRTIGAGLRYRTEDAVTKAMLRSAVAFAAAGEAPPLQWRLFADAERRLIRDRRQSIVEAGSAAEVAVAEAVRNRLGDISAEAQEQIIHNANGIVGLVRLVESLDGTTPEQSQVRRVAGLVAGLRNDAAHRGQEPSLPDLHAALDVIRELLEAYAPPPQPGPLEDT